MNNKGFVDSAYLAVFTVVAFFLILIVSFLYGTLKDELNTFDVIANDTSAQEVFNYSDIVNNNWDWLFVLVFLGFIGGIIITLYFLRSSPILFIVGLIGLFVVIILSIILIDVFGQAINETPHFSEEVSNYPASAFIFNYLPIILLVVMSGFLIFIYLNKGGYV